MLMLMYTLGYGYGSIPMKIAFLGEHPWIPAILMWTTGVQGFDTLPYYGIYIGISWVNGECYMGLHWLQFWGILIHHWKWMTNPGSAVVRYNLFCCPRWA
jgi:hypothetical protein